MLALESGLIPLPPGWFDLYAPFILIAVIVFMTILALLRGGRNSILEQIITRDNYGSPNAFRGSLVVEDNEPGRRLQLLSSTKEARRLRFYYRWIIGSGPEAKFDEVTFDGPRGVVEMTARDKVTSHRFSEISAIRLRERAGRGVSLWHLELIQCNGKVIRFVSSAIGGREMMFNQTAAVAKAASAITSLPIQVFAAGNVWTPGWPPRSHTSFRTPN